MPARSGRIARAWPTPARARRASSSTLGVAAATWDCYFAGPRRRRWAQAPAEVGARGVLQPRPRRGRAAHPLRLDADDGAEQALAARERGCTAALVAGVGDLADSRRRRPRAGELAERAAYCAPTEGRVLYAGLTGARPRPRSRMARALARGSAAPRAPRRRRTSPRLVAEGRRRPRGAHARSPSTPVWSPRSSAGSPTCHSHCWPRSSAALQRPRPRDGATKTFTEVGPGDQGSGRDAHRPARRRGVRRAHRRRGRASWSPVSSRSPTAVGRPRTTRAAALAPSARSRARPATPRARRRTASASRRAGDMVPPALTLGPLGSAERLNWLAKNRLTKTSSQCRIGGQVVRRAPLVGEARRPLPRLRVVPGVPGEERDLARAGSRGGARGRA